MPTFCASLTTLFTEYPLIERFEAAKEAGFDVVEILFPYDNPAFFTQIDKDGYKGVVSGEYNPKDHTLDGLAWINL